ncbi:MAG: membrane protein insertase YidC [Candidatus Omnitrophica bacterium]|nr:membrane protein insertase YidC [Candidatus Omnitrophota bacterium]
MDDTGKRLLLAMALSLVVLWGYNRFFVLNKPGPGQEQEQVPGQISSQKRETSPVFSDNSPGQQLKTQTQGIRPVQVPAVLAPKPMAEETTRIETDNFIAVITNLGGYIKELRLKEKHTDKNVLLSQALDPGTGIGSLELEGLGPAQKTIPYKIEKAGQVVICRSEISPGLEIVKRFNFNNPGCALNLNIRLENKTQQDRQIKYKIIGALGRNSDKYDRRDRGYLKAATKIKNLKKEKELGFGKLRSGPRFYIGQTEWTGVKEKYFCQIIKPDNFETAGAFSVLTPKQILAAGIETPVFLLPRTGTTDHGYKIYAGLMRHTNLREFGADGVIDYGLFSPISQALLFLLKIFQKIFRNWGLAIIAVSVLVKLLLHPLTAKSMRSMKAMQALQPHMAKIREEHKDNSQKMNKETMELYRKHKVNPLGGCFPMLLQMPVFIALYQTLNRSIEIRGARFLWIKDLSFPDEIWTLPFKIPLINTSALNVLPILMALLMVAQQKLTPSAGGTEQQAQQKMMMMMMPVLFGFIFYNFASGLVLYWLVNTILSVAHQYSVMKKPSEPKISVV